MNESAKGAEEEAKSGGALQSLAASATEQLPESVSSLAGSAVEEGASRVNDFSINVLRSHLDRMVKERSVVGAGENVSIADGVTMSPMIRAMLEGLLSLSRWRWPWQDLGCVRSDRSRKDCRFSVLDPRKPHHAPHAVSQG